MLTLRKCNRARKLRNGTKATEINNMTGHQMAVLAFQLHLTTPLANGRRTLKKYLHTWPSANHLVLILLWNKNEAISFLLLNRLLLVLLTHVFSPCWVLLWCIWGLIAPPTFHTVNKYKQFYWENLKLHTQNSLYLVKSELLRFV